MELLDYEKKHIDYLKENSAECALFMKKDGSFPLKEPCRTVLVGNGARQTVKGGTGSGDVASRFFSTFEDGLKNAGFEITSTEWLDRYDAFRQSTLKDYIKDGKRLARKLGVFAGVYSMGFFEEEKNYPFEVEDYDGEVAIYVLARNSGEGNDRRYIKGDVLLSDKEVKDILYLNKKFEKFVLVLNVGGPVDLTPVLEVKNILYISQLGVVTGDILPAILLGKANPSGKLTTTWARGEDYLFFDEFGNPDDTCYKEGIYVGYRYFASVKKEPMFPFGFGLSYSSFDVADAKVIADGLNVRVTAKVTNISSIPGKEVVQVYLSKPQGQLDQPKIELCGYAKTKLLNSNESDFVEIDFSLLDFVSYDEKRAANLLEKGKYVVSIGNSSDNLTAVVALELENDVIKEQLENKCGKPSFDDYRPVLDLEDEISNIDVIKLNTDGLLIRNVEYINDEHVDERISKLTNKELALFCLGQYKNGFAWMVGNSAQHVIGGAGETSLNVPSIQDSLTMADGPAGLRLKQTYGVDKKGIYDIVADPLMIKMAMFLPLVARPFFLPPKNRHGEVHHQFTTAIPIGTALAQSFNNEFIESCGRLVAEEMEIFNVDLWLAPALNIHRNILCGRNFEYFSEDPFLSGMVASSITNGVQGVSKKGVTIKHFAGNNQEVNRNNSNSQISERALREIYLRGFEICIKKSSPKALMTSYNLINGTHTSESHDLINDILRCEWGYDGLVMTDWIATGRTWRLKSIHPAPYASKNILAGNDLTMPGGGSDYKDIMKALRKGKLTRDDLINSASRIYRSIMRQK